MMPEPRFELRSVSETEWSIVDHKYQDDDARGIVARVYEVGTVEVDVVWMRDLPMASTYMSAEDVLVDLRRFYAVPDRSTTPVIIPHLPPIAP